MSVVPSRQNSLSGSCKEEFKLNNLESASSQPLKSAEASADVKEDIHEDNKVLKKLIDPSSYPFLP